MSKQQHQLYAEASEGFAPAIARLAHTVEFNAAKARELEQDIHAELFKSFARFDGRCALKTWVYRVAHNVAGEYKLRASRAMRTVALSDLDEVSLTDDSARTDDEADALARAQSLIRQLPLLDAQVMLLWLEAESAKDIAEITGLTPGAVATRINRLKSHISESLSPPNPQEHTHD